jgi:hypothetical protein
MKGITNYEMREFFETITDELKNLKTKQTESTDTTLFLIATITAVTATLLYLLQTHPVLLFFMISSVASMGAILVKKQIESTH